MYDRWAKIGIFTSGESQNCHKDVPRQQQTAAGSRIFVHKVQVMICTFYRIIQFYKPLSLIGLEVAGNAPFPYSWAFFSFSCNFLRKNCPNIKLAPFLGLALLSVWKVLDSPLIIMNSHAVPASFIKGFHSYNAAYWWIQWALFIRVEIMSTLSSK